MSIENLESPIELALYQAMQFYDLEPEIQYKIGKYRVDFAFPRQLLIVEADGKAYHSSRRQKSYDRRRENWLRSQGWDVIRFTGQQIYRARYACAHEVWRFLNGPRIN